MRLLPQADTAVLVLQGGDARRMPGDLPALLHRCGAYVTAVRGGRYTAVARLPLSPTLPLRDAPDADALVVDKYSTVRVYLDGLCVEDE